MRKYIKRLLCLALAICMAVNIIQISDARAATGKKKVIIVLDPGHGGADSGAARTINGTLYCERDLVLKIAKYCKEELEKNDNVKVYLTRKNNTDTCMSRSERVLFAKKKKADMLISFHINATAEQMTSTYGAEIYYQNGNYRKDLSNFSYTLSSDIMKRLNAVGLRNAGVKYRDSTDKTLYPDGSLADYLGINYWSKLYGMPGILIEHGYINSTHDVYNYLNTDAKLKALGVADAKGIMDTISRGNYEFSTDEGLVVADAKGKWIKNSTGWWYRYKGGGYPASKWEMIDGEWRYFNSSGYMVTGWQKINNTWYYFDSDGTMATGWRKISGKRYYLNETGCMATGWKKVGNSWYLLGANGIMTTGWQKVNGKWYYLNKNGKMVTGWFEDNGKTYYLGKSNGAMVTGIKKIDGEKYFFNSTGDMSTGWHQVKDNWYYFKKDGTMAVDRWIGKYYVDENGVWVVDAKKEETETETEDDEIN